MLEKHNRAQLLGILAMTVLFLSVSAMLSVSPGLADEQTLLMATTTSTDDTGLLDYLAPIIKKDTGIELKWVAVGTGKALKHGENCDVSVLMVHAPEAEEQYVAQGFGVDRRLVMYNDFIIVGPGTDPAGLKGLSIPQALKIITDKGAVFVSRGDKSGTHQKELTLWAAAKLPVPDKKEWYIQTGQGMLNSMVVAENKAGYIMVDRGTYIKYEDNHKGNPPLVILIEGDKSLLNQYSVMAVNPSRCRNATYERAIKFMDWIVSPQGQKAIAGFQLLGKQLFTPNAKK